MSIREHSNSIPLVIPLLFQFRSDSNYFRSNYFHSNYLDNYLRVPFQFHSKSDPIPIRIPFHIGPTFQNTWGHSFVMQMGWEGITFPGESVRGGGRGSIFQETIITEHLNGPHSKYISFQFRSNSIPVPFQINSSSIRLNFTTTN